MIQKTLDVISHCRRPDTELRIEQAIARMGRVTGVSRFTLQRKSAAKSVQNPLPTAQDSKPNVSRAEIELFWAMLADQRVAATALERVDPQLLESDISRSLFELMRQLEESAKPITASVVMTATDDPNVKWLIAEAGETRDVIPRECFESLERRFYLRESVRDVTNIAARIAGAVDDQMECELLQQLINRKRESP